MHFRVRRSDRAQHADPPAIELPKAARADEKSQLRDRSAVARFLGNKRVRRTIAGAALTTTSLISIPLLAHHPGAPQPASPANDRPAATAAPFPEQSAPSSSSTATPATEAPAPAPTEAPAPAPPPRAALDPALSGFTNVQKTLSEPFPGIRYLSATADGQRIHITDIDLTNPAYEIRVTASEERNQTTTSFARATDAFVAINGDFFDYNGYRPVGLAISEGRQWPDSADTMEWLFLACTKAKHCEVDSYNHLAQPNAAWDDAIGANGVPLVVDGQPRYHDEAFYSTDRHPRSAVGLTSDGRMILIAAEGRQNDAVGMTFNEMARVMSELGVDQALMFDGGGSTSMVIGGERVNELPSGSGERSVANHIAIVPAG